MLGYANAVDCEAYTTTLPSVLADLLGFRTMVVGKNHFGATTARKRTRTSNNSTNGNGTNGHHNPQEQKFIDHGYQCMELYEGISMHNKIKDDYDTFFESILPGVDPLSTCGGLGWNDWNACPYKFEEYLHPTAWTTRQALKVIDETFVGLEGDEDHNVGNDDDDDDDDDGNDRNHHHYSAQKPVFLKVSYHRPHSPYDPPKRFWEKHMSRKNDPKYKRNICNDQHDADDANSNATTTTTCWDREYLDRTATGKMPHDAWQGDPGDDAARTSRAAYQANVEFVDEGIGRILDRLNSGGRNNNTLIIWTSDHGDMNGDHNLWRKGYPWEASSHVNMVVRIPTSMATSVSEQRPQQTIDVGTDVPKSATSAITTSKAIVEIRDVAPTIYDVLGILNKVTDSETGDPLVNGRSLLPILNGSANDVRSHLDMEHSTVYDDRIHWNAIVGRLPPDGFDHSGVGGCEDTDSIGGSAHSNSNININININNISSSSGLYKYIFFARDGAEQLFCLSEDSKELHDLALIPEYESVLEFWRTTMGQQFLDEGRGEEWVTQGGELVAGRSCVIFGPNYPCRETKVETRTKGTMPQ